MSTFEEDIRKTLKNIEEGEGDERVSEYSRGVKKGLKYAIAVYKTIEMDAKGDQMSNTLFGYSPINRVCRDCRKKYTANIYDPGSIRCPICRGKIYRIGGLNLVTNNVEVESGKEVL